MATIKSNTPIREPPGTQLLLQMECITTMTTMITFIDTWFKSLFTQQTPKEKKEYSINLSFILSTYRVLVSLDGNYQLDMRGRETGD